MILTHGYFGCETADNVADFEQGCFPSFLTPHTQMGVSILDVFRMVSTQFAALSLQFSTQDQQICTSALCADPQLFQELWILNM